MIISLHHTNTILAQRPLPLVLVLVFLSNSSILIPPIIIIHVVSLDPAGLGSHENKKLGCPHTRSCGVNLYAHFPYKPAQTEGKPPIYTTASSTSS
ncbi:hypothetical protein QBC34DRAFT_70280 [Podospora aff. communis PSN243]|uniref:Uncharacterized protein n=1 Tax=Podospora aff. communis PSN243 TaxID=3040156 RepID=A0AAV9H743_9PEZI|nr:hypothetical protein QBC34DRAFT_70280 [Podospora aff. communis PSN243]